MDTGRCGERMEKMIPFEEKLAREMEGVRPGEIILLEATPEDMLKAKMAAAKVLSGAGYGGIAFAINRTWKDLLSDFALSGVKTGSLFIIDCVSKRFARARPSGGNIRYVKDLTQLSSLSIIITEKLRMMEGRKFLLVDSLSIMLMHNDPESTARFLYAALMSTRVNGAVGVVVTHDSEIDRKIFGMLVELSDRQVRLSLEPE